jgi:hypothetical protein
MTRLEREMAADFLCLLVIVVVMPLVTFVTVLAIAAARG